MDRIKTQFANEIEVQHVFHAKPNKQGRYLIYVRFYIHLKTIRKWETTVSTGITTAPERWNGGTIKGTDVLTKEKNERLAEILTTVKDALHDLKKLKVQNIAIIKAEIDNGLKVKIRGKAPKGQKSKYLSMIVNHTMDAVKDNYLNTVHVSTTYTKNFRLAVQKFSEWWRLNYSTSLPTIGEVTTKDIKSFKAWFEKQEVEHNTVMTYMNRLRTIFNHALNEKLITESPIPKRGLIEGYKKGKQVALTTDELKKFKNLPDEHLSESHKKVKYIFLFLCSTGMGYGELKSLRLEHIEKEGNDFIISKERNKTEIPFYLPLSETAKHIYTNYFNPFHDEGVQPFDNLPSIEYVTRIVKVLATLAGIDKSLSTYVGRKTFATQWATDGNNIYFLQMILGHSDIKRTMDYVSLRKNQMLNYAKEAFKRNAFHTMN